MPTTIGEIAIGRSASALSSRFPGKRYRVSSSATPTPKTMLSATAAIAVSAVSSNALTAWDELIADQNASRPGWKVRQVTMPSGTNTSTAM
jgi:hypothetical protein